MLIFTHLEQKINLLKEILHCMNSVLNSTFHHIIFWNSASQLVLNCLSHTLKTCQNIISTYHISATTYPLREDDQHSNSLQKLSLSFGCILHQHSPRHLPGSSLPNCLPSIKFSLLHGMNHSPKSQVSEHSQHHLLHLNWLRNFRHNMNVT